MAGVSVGTLLLLQGMSYAKLSGTTANYGLCHSATVPIGFILKRLAIERNVAVLVTNHMVGGERGIVKPALGESWKRMTHIRLLLSREPDNNICTVSILKHSSVVLQRSLFLWSK